MKRILNTLRRWVAWAATLPLLAACAHLISPIERQQMTIPMRDGVRLAADVYLPKGDGPFPVVVARSVYGRGNAQIARPFVNEGLVFVAQDVRGRGDSEGIDRVFLDDAWGERADGFDTIDWVRRQPWCNGKVGTWGGSALGITQTLLAGSGAPLDCQFIEVAPSTLYGQMTYRGGVAHKSQCEFWLTGQGRPETIEEWRRHPTNDALWRGLNAEPRAAKMTAPAVHVGGWWDMFTQGTLNSFTTRQHDGAAASDNTPGARGRQQLIVGPWSHASYSGPDTLGELTFPANQRFDVPGHMLRWYRHWLLDEPNGIMDEPAVRYYVVGDTDDPDAPGNEWRTAEDWPPQPFEATPLYLEADGVLTFDGPTAEPHERTFTYDPADPCPTLGGANYDLAQGPFDQRPVSSRPDVLRFATPPLEAPLEITGPVSVDLWVSTDAPDTDFTAKLVDIYPDGREMLMLDGIQRVKFRHGCEAPDPVEPGRVVLVRIDLWSISLVFNRGHRIGLQVSSSNYPRFEKNPNTGEDFPTTGSLRVAHNSVHVGPEHASALILPVVGE